MAYEGMEAQVITPKMQDELNWQKGWAKELEGNWDKVRGFWEDHRFLHEIKALCKPTHESCIIDVGCGLATGLMFFPGTLTACDPLIDHYLELTPDVFNHFHSAPYSGENLEYSASTFDLALCTNVLDHVSDPGVVIDEMHRVLKPSGHLVLSVEIWPQENHNRNPAHPWGFTANQVRGVLAGRFERVVEHTTQTIGVREYVLDLDPPKGTLIHFGIYKAVD